MKQDLATRFRSLLPKTLTIFSFLLFISLTRSVSAQLDSMEVSLTVVSRDYIDIDSTVIPQNWLHMVLVPNDLSDLGYIQIVVYSHNDGSVLREIFKSKQELIDEGFIVDDMIAFDPFFYEPEIVYRITVSPQNNDGAYTQDYTVFYPEMP